MRSVNRFLFAISTFVLFINVVFSKYTETMDPDGLTRNLVADFGLLDDNAQNNQSGIFQHAIDSVAAAGGGNLIVPKGTYRLSNVVLKSNVHLLIDAGTVIKPDWPAGTKVVVFLMDAGTPTNKRNLSMKQEQAYIENVSIRGVGGPFIIDYSDRERVNGEGIRGILARMVRNFLIENVDIRDNYSVYCGITLVPWQTAKETKDWPVSRATDGTVRNCRIFNASPGYGLTQLHGAQSIYFENLYAKGGVTLRLETGAVGLRTGVYDITARNVVNEDGRCAVMFGPHSAMNGLVQVEDVVSISSAFAVTMGKGGVKEAQLKIEPDATDGVFADGSSVKNIRAVFGKTAQVKTHSMMHIPEEYIEELDLRWEDKFFEGPSIGAVKDDTEGHFKVIIENVIMEGFKNNNDKPILKPEDARPGKWAQELRKWKELKGL